jgi:hypothetical protein
MKDLQQQKAAALQIDGDDKNVDPALERRIEARRARLVFEQAIEEALAAFAAEQRERGVPATRHAILDLTEIYSKDITQDYHSTADAQPEHCQGWPLLRLPCQEAYLVSTTGRLHVLDANAYARPARADDVLYLMLCINKLKGTVTGAASKEHALLRIIEAAQAGEPLYADPFEQ